MKINPGEFVAIVGTPGSGKSTLLRMLLGFETPDAGSIFYDKQNIENIDKSQSAPPDRNRFTKLKVVSGQYSFKYCGGFKLFG